MEVTSPGINILKCGVKSTNPSELHSPEPVLNTWLIILPNLCQTEAHQKFLRNYFLRKSTTLTMTWSPLSLRTKAACYRYLGCH
jgi:hypothetical protein